MDKDTTQPRISRGTFRFAIAFIAMLSGAAQCAEFQGISLVPEKVPPVIADRQDSQVADRIQLEGWIGTRIHANDANRLVKIDSDRLLEGYRKRPGRQTWDGEHVGKWLHAATLAWANSGNPELRKKLDYVAVELAKCQLDDGYLGTYLKEDRWTFWDVWAHKYNLLGLITYMRYTGNMAPLSTCRRMADLLCNTFGDKPEKRDIVLSGQHMGMASTSVLEPMVLLYRFTGEDRYLEFCKYILRAWEQPNGPKVISTLLKQKRVDKVGNGKAYEMISCFNGALEFYRTTGDKKMLEACLNAWQDIVNKRLYLTGTASYREFFRDDFDLPNVNNVGETCVTVTWLQFNAQLLRLTGEARFAEELERTTLNQLFGAQCPDGSAWGYYVQMQGKKPYNGTLDGHCCLSSGPRGVALIPTFAMSTDAEGLVINLYDSGTGKLTLRDGTAVTVTTETLYPSDGMVRIRFSPDKKTSFVAKLRIPSWCKKPEISVNGKAITPKHSSGGYVGLKREWANGDEVQLQIPLAPRLVLGQRVNEHRLAVLYGPLVLTSDEALVDKTDVSLNEIGAANPQLVSLQIKAESAPEKLRTWPGATVFKMNAVKRNATSSATAQQFPIRLVPFADAGSMGTEYKVWLPYKAPRADRNLLMDGVEFRSRKPNMGSILDGNCETVAVTYSGKRAPDDWFGVFLDEPALIKHIVFAHGKAFHDGGWFDASKEKPRVQLKLKPDGEWKTASEFKDYPATTATNPAGLKDGARFTYTLPEPTKVFGVRVVGKPACGDDPKQNFSSCAELQAFGPKN